MSTVANDPNATRLEADGFVGMPSQTVEGYGRWVDPSWEALIHAMTPEERRQLLREMTVAEVSAPPTSSGSSPELPRPQFAAEGTPRLGVKCAGSVGLRDHSAVRACS